MKKYSFLNRKTQLAQLGHFKNIPFELTIFYGVHQLRYFTYKHQSKCGHIVKNCQFIEMSGQSYSLGEKVRVNCSNNRSAHAGIISGCNTDKTYDVIYDRKANTLISHSDEELLVHDSRISKLLPFEKVSCPSQSALQSKEYGNALFKLKDYDSAIFYYKSALDLILPKEKVHYDDCFYYRFTCISREIAS
jgi:tetratricopeptide (TPR) repeat protein